MPEAASAAGVQGAVIVEVVIDESGAVTQPRILRSIPLLDDAALEAVREWRFEPTVVDGRAVPVRMTLTGQFSYRLNNSSSISGGGGASSLESPGTGEGTTAPTFHVGFDRVMRTLRMSASYSRGFEQLFGFGSLVGSDTFSGGAFIPLADRLYYLDATLTYTHSDPGRSLGIGFEYTTLWSNVTVGRQLTPYLRGEGFVSFGHQSSNGPDSTNHTRIGVQIVTSKPMRIQ